MEKKTKIFTCCVTAVILCFFTWFLSNDIFSGDDITGLISFVKGGGKYNFDGILTVFLSNFFGQYLPSFLHINPHQFSMTAGAVIRSINVTALFVVMSLFMYCGRKKTSVFPFIIPLSALYFCYASSNMDFDWLNTNGIPLYNLEGSFIMLTEYSQHFGQLLTFIFGLFTVFCIISDFVQNKMPDGRRFIFYTAAIFISAFSSMFVSIFTGITLSLVYIYLLFANYGKNTIFANIKKFCIPFFAYILGSAIFAFYPGFLNYFSTDIKLKVLLKTLYKTILMQNSLEFALIIIFAAVLYFLALKKSTFIKRVIFSSCSLICSVFVYFMMFTKLGNTIPVELTESLVLTRLLLFSLILLLFGACERELTGEVKTRKLIKVVTGLTLFAFVIIQSPFVYNTMKLWRTMSEETKVTTYCIEKMYRFYSLKDKTALLPEDSLMKIFKISNFIDDKNLKQEEKITGMTFLKETSFTAYYRKNYKNAKIVPYKFINSKRALKIFFEEGGMINSEEIKHINFQNLYDDKFVLNRAIAKAKYGG